MMQASGLILLNNTAAGSRRDGSGMQPPPYGSTTTTNVARQYDIATSTVKEKEMFLQFTRVLMKYLEQRDTNMHIKAKAKIKECYEKNQYGDPDYSSLTTSMKIRLRQTVGERYWKLAHNYLDRFLQEKAAMEKKKAEDDKMETVKRKAMNIAPHKRRAEQKKLKEEEKIAQLKASKDKEIAERDKEIAILQDAVETVDMTNDELEPASKRLRTEGTPKKSLAGILLEETGKKLVKVKQEQVETRADLEDVRDDLDIANETVTQQAVFTDAWQSKFDELAAIAQAAGVDGKTISDIRNRSITS